MIAATALQISFEVGRMNEATAMLVIGIIGLLLYASIKFVNPLASACTMVTILLFALGATLDMGAELFWMGVVSTVVILIAGIIVRVGS